jgi:RNA polymerase sigma-70 factor, ECF subfamily
VEVERRLRVETLWARYAPDVRDYAVRRSDSATADDVLMEVFVIACRRLDELPAEPLPWLLGCARRVLANHRRGARRADALVERIGTTLSSRTGGQADGEALHLALRALSESDREILFLSAWEGLTPAGLGAVLGCSRATAAVWLHRARRRLARVFADVSRSAAGAPDTQPSTEALP